MRSIVWIVFGVIVGAVEKFIMPGRDPGGIIVTIVLGTVGALLGGWGRRWACLRRASRPGASGP
jgi:uncharacterized membrane protein YeaQ/YmgE (transglycosylase-associated protein family)